jgi:hypothetical protein
VSDSKHIHCSTTNPEATTVIVRIERGDEYVVLVSNQTGVLTIKGPDDVYGARWSTKPEHLGAANLFEFIVAGNKAMYLAEKLTVEGQRYEIDEKATVKAFKQAVVAKRPAGLDALFKEIDDADWLYAVFTGDYPAVDVLGDGAELLVCHRYRRAYEVLWTEVLPALIIALRDVKDTLAMASMPPAGVA